MSGIEKTLRPRNTITVSLSPRNPISGPAIPPLANLRYNFKVNPASKNDENVPLKKSSRIKKSFLNQIRKYCENTTLHGLKYVGDAHLTYGERIFWFFSFFLAIGVASYYISLIITKWNSSPVIISFSPFDTDASAIPFPAVTICNMNQAKKSEAEKILREGSAMDKKLLDDCCKRNATFNNTEKIEWKSLQNFLIRVGHSCSDLLKSCQWGTDRVKCNEIFNNELTDEGLCCTFNRLPPENIFRNWTRIRQLNATYPDTVIDWDAERGFRDDDGDDFIPRKPLGAGTSMGISVTLDLNVDNYYCSSTHSAGFKISLSNPMQPAQMMDYGIFVMPGFETQLSIEPSVTEATASLRRIPIDKRQCYFTNERPLVFYRKYSAENCRLECQSIKILERCGCVPYYLPKDQSTDVCPRNDKCAQRTRDLIAMLDGGFKGNTSDTSLTCDCLPRCFRVNFDYFITSAPIKIFKKTKYSAEFIRENLARVIMYFDSTTYSRILKMPLYNFTDLMAYTGGLLGLFIGFSFLSVIEIFFHMVWNTWRKYALAKYKKNTKIQNEDEDLPPLFPFVN